MYKRQLDYTVCWQSTMELCEGSTESGKAVNAGSTGISTAEGWWYPMSLKEVCPGLPDWKALKEPECIEALATAETAPKGANGSGAAQPAASEEPKAEKPKAEQPAAEAAGKGPDESLLTAGDA